MTIPKEFGAYIGQGPNGALHFENARVRYDPHFEAKGQWGNEPCWCGDVWADCARDPSMEDVWLVTAHGWVRLKAAADELQAGSENSPVTGLRRASAVLGVGRNTIARRIRDLPKHARPRDISVGEAPRWWWPSEADCLEWWSAANRPSARPSKPARNKPAHSLSASALTTTTLSDALQELTGD